MASIVISPARRLLMAALGLATLLAAGRLAARPRAVAIAVVAAAADGERPPAMPAMA
jgi:uncharacterized membrane protein